MESKTAREMRIPALRREATSLGNRGRRMSIGVAASAQECGKRKPRYRKGFDAGGPDRGRADISAAAPSRGATHCSRTRAFV